MYGLAVMLSISTQTNLKNIDKIVLHKTVKTNSIIKTSQDSLKASVNLAILIFVLSFRIDTKKVKGNSIPLK